MTDQKVKQDQKVRDDNYNQERNLKILDQHIAETFRKIDKADSMVMCLYSTVLRLVFWISIIAFTSVEIINIGKNFVK
jgi:hypothetical protein